VKFENESMSNAIADASTATHSDCHYLKNFESFGANCEFGFVQERCEVDVGSLFRWAEIPSIKALTEIINADFKDVYLFENLRPFNAGMVRDVSSGIAWHSILRSEIVDASAPPVPENFVFVRSESERRALWAQEVGKVKFLAEKTRAGLRVGNRIYVYKPLRDIAVSDLELDELFGAIQRAGGKHLLFVSTASKNDIVGEVIVMLPGIMKGKIDRFAPGNNARDISFTAWLKLCRAAVVLSS
jgi:hypothetical protein